MSDHRVDRPRPVVLVAEDEFLIACDMVETIQIAGFDVEGPHASVASATEALKSTRPDCAVLDIRLCDHDVFPLADQLQAADIPIIFHSGHGEHCDIEERYPDARLCNKPYPPGDMIDLIRSTVTIS